MPLPTPLNNNCLIEVIDEYEHVSRSDGDDPLNTGKDKFGRIMKASVSGFHITVASSMKLDERFAEETLQSLKDMIGRIVRWEEMAEVNSFEQDGKKYVLVPWWRLTAVEGK